MALRMAARSTTTGTPVKSCNSTLAGLNGTSALIPGAAVQAARFLTSCSVTSEPSQFRSTDSSSTRIDSGRAAMFACPQSSSRLNR